MFLPTRHTRRALLLAATITPLLTAVSSAVEPAPSSADEKLADLSTRVQSGLDAIRAKYDLPGITAAYALPDGDVVAFATGLADRQSGAPMTVDSRMLAGSVGKTFVAATALALAQEGRLSLDDRIEKFLGQEPWFDHLPAASDITVRHLAMHRAGLADHVYEPRFAAAVTDMIEALDTNPDRYFKPTELIDFIVDRDPLYEPGHGYAYTDTGYILLGLIIERAGAAPYYDQVRHRFLEPLKLTRTVPADRRQLDHLASGYLAEDNPFGLPQKITADVGVMRYNPRTEWTGGGLVSNPQDLVRWAKALYEGRALDQPYVDELVAPHPLQEENESWYGLGVSVSQTPLGTSYGHGGWTPGYLTHMAYFPDHRVAFAVQINSDARDDMLADVMLLLGDILQTTGKAD